MLAVEEVKKGVAAVEFEEKAAVVVEVDVAAAAMGEDECGLDIDVDCF